MDENIQIQLPNPQEHIVNSAAYQQSGSPTGSAFDFKKVMVGTIIVVVIGGAGWGVWSVKKALESFSDSMEQRSDAISQVLEADEEESFGIIGKANASYDNPFEEEGSYDNPFEEENPFDE